jgi:hypothetical protein
MSTTAPVLPSQDTPPPAKRKFPLWAIITLSVVGGLLVVFIGLGMLVGVAASIADSTEDKAPSTSQEKPAAPAEEEPAEEEPAAEPETGGLDNPWPKGYEPTITESGADLYTVAFTLVDGDANAAIHEANQFNEAAPAGQHYVIIEATFTGLDADFPVSPGSAMWDWSIADQDGAIYQSGLVVTPGESISGAPDLYKGQSYTGQEAYLVPDGTTVLYMSALGKYVTL